MDIKWVLVTLALNGQHEGVPTFSTAEECAKTALKINEAIARDRLDALAMMPAYLNQRAKEISTGGVLDAFADFSINFTKSNMDESTTIKLLSLASKVKSSNENESSAQMGCDQYEASIGKYQPITDACKAFEVARSQDANRLIKKDLAALPENSTSCIPLVSD